MGKRYKIGIIYQKSEGWIGGTYYIQNLISALNLLDEDKKPLIKLFCNGRENFDELKNITKYNHLLYEYYDVASLSRYQKLATYINRLFNRYGYLQKNHIKTKDSDVDFIYPVTERSQIDDNQKALVWIPDFQEIYYPNLFSRFDIMRRRLGRESIVRNQIPIVFSSHDALHDFERLCPGNDNKKFVLQFAVTHPDYSSERIDNLKAKYKIQGDYFFCANQFWMHKNHFNLFKAFKRYKDLGGNKLLVCSGKMEDYRNPNYINELKQYIEENGLEKSIIVIGFISRTEQLCLMSNSYAIIQPSLFEGWSTVVEDAKSLNKFIFLSDIKVHKEQSPSNSCFFNPTDIKDIAYKLHSTTITNIYQDYKKNIISFAKTFIEIFDNLKH